MSYTYRRMKAGRSEEIFRVVQSGTRSDGSTWELIYGPYSTKGTAKGVLTRNNKYSRGVFKLQRSTTAWEDIE